MICIIWIQVLNRDTSLLHFAFRMSLLFDYELMLQRLDIIAYNP